MRLSVIVTAYNREDSIARCIDSILSQGMDDMELIIVDDGSMDGTADIVADYTDRDGRVVSLFQENMGVAAARNRGLSAASGEYVTFVDSDDYLKEGAIARLNEVAEAGDLDILVFDGALVTPGGEEGYLPTFRDGQEGVKGGMLSRQQYIISSPNPWNKWVRRKLYKECFGSLTPFPNGLRYEDYATMPILALSADRIGYLPEALYGYVQSPGSIMRTIGYNKYYDDIFPASARLKKFLGDEFRDEVEYMFFEHLLVSGGKRYLACKRREGLRRCADIMRNNYPHWKDNKYVAKEPFKKRRLADLIYMKRYGLLKILGK